MASCEIEIKSLLGSEDRARDLKGKLAKLYPDSKLVCKEKQLNHYFIGGDEDVLLSLITPKLSKQEQEKLKYIVDRGETFSVRTRLIDDAELLFVIKASLDEGSSHNTISRLEFETKIKGVTIDELDRYLLDAGFTYQAKWSREREVYKCNDISVCFDKNAGYGYVAEFEKVVSDEEKVLEARQELQTFMKRLGASELPQERLERMFAYYNTHWPEYYGTTKIFVVK